MKARSRWAQAGGVGCFTLAFGLAAAHLGADGTPAGLALTIGGLAIGGVILTAKAHARG